MATESTRAKTMKTVQMVNTLTTVDDCTKFIKNLNVGAVETMYYIGKTLLRAKLLNSDLNVVEYGMKEFGYKQAFIYRVMKVADSFTIDTVLKYGIEKLYLIGNDKELDKYSPEMTLKEVKEVKANNKTKERKVDPKKEFIKKADNLIKAINEFVEKYGVETESYSEVVKDLENRLKEIQ